MDLPHIVAAGGIVVRHDPDPRIGVVQLRKNKAWVLPKGKLSRKETALAAARREVLEETGHDVSVHEFVGALSYESRGLPKVVQFWRMQVLEGPSRKLMRDVRAVEWLPLPDAIERLTRAHERLFLEHVGPVVLRAATEKTEKKRAPAARRKPVRLRTSTTPKRAPRKPVPLEPAVEAMLEAQATAEALYAAVEINDVAMTDAAPDMMQQVQQDAPPETAAPLADSAADTHDAKPRPWLHVIDRLLGRPSSRNV